MQKRIVDYTREEVDNMFGYDMFPSEFLITFNQERNEDLQYKEQVDKDIDGIVKFINEHTIKLRKKADKICMENGNMPRFWYSYRVGGYKYPYQVDHDLTAVDAKRVKKYLDVLDYNFGNTMLHDDYIEQFTDMYATESPVGELACDRNIEDYPDHISRYVLEIDDPIIQTSLEQYRLKSSNLYWDMEYKKHRLDVWIAVTYYFFGLAHNHDTLEEDVLNSVFGDFAVVHQGLGMYAAYYSVVNDEWDNAIMNILYSVWSFGSAWSITHTEKEVRRIMTESFKYVQDHINSAYGRQSIQDHARIWVNLIRWGLYNELTSHYNIHAPMYLNLRSYYFDSTRYDYCGGSIDMKWVSGTYQNSILYGEWGYKNKLYDSSLDMPETLDDTFTIYGDKWVTCKDRKQTLLDELLSCVLDDMGCKDSKHIHPAGMSDYEYSKLRHKESYLQDTVETLEEVLEDEFKGL